MTTAFRILAPALVLRAVGAAALAATVLTAPVPAMAQDRSDEARLRKIEAEIRALQRSVFPGGDGRFFEPQIRSSDGATPADPAGKPSTTAVTDILARLDALEQQLQRLTALTEENTNSIALLDTRLASLEASGRSGAGMGSGMGAGTGANASGPAAATTPAPPRDRASNAGATDTNLAVMTGAQSGTGAPRAASQAPASGPSAARLAAVQAITKPQTDDPADDEYSYGFRLWSAGFYPEARQQLSRFVEQYPNHWRATWGRNLLGRAFLDDGMAEEAARWFLRNYQADKTAARAPDSLLYLAESMIAMKDTKRACIALSEFADTYAAVATGRLASEYEANRRKVRCDK